MNTHLATLCLLTLCIPFPGPSRAAPPSSTGTPAMTLVYLDTETLDRQARAGEPVTLPFELPTGERVDKTLRLRLIDLRGQRFVGAVLKDGSSQQGKVLKLPPPSTYQGIVGNRGSAAVTITAQAVEGHFIDRDGWSVIEPLEPLLRQIGIAPQHRRGLLDRVNHVLYNATVRGIPPRPSMALPRASTCTLEAGQVGGCAPRENAAPSASSQTTRQRLRLRVVLDGDPELQALYPDDSVLPFWRKQEAMLNTLDWLLNCLEPEADVHNDYAYCHNEFDGGHDAYRVRVEIAGLEVWVEGGPKAHNRYELLRQSIRETHQADPPCCGPPHTAGKADLVVFLSGRPLEGGAGVASVAGLAVHDEAQCLADSPCCHHAVSQMIGNENLDGSAYQQIVLFAHEVGHVLGGPEQVTPIPVRWLDNLFCGPALMHSGFSFSPGRTFQYSEKDARENIAPLLHERLSPIREHEP